GRGLPIRSPSQQYHSPAVLQDLVGKSVHGRFGICGVELCDNYHTLPLWCGTALVRCACRDGLSASGLVERFRSRAGGASPFAALCGRMSNLYPTPGTERMNRGVFGSGSILRRRRATSITTPRSYGSAPRPATAVPSRAPGRTPRAPP